MKRFPDFIVIIALSVIFLTLSGSCSRVGEQAAPAPLVSELSGFLGDEINSGSAGRLSHFITDRSCAAVRIFHADSLETKGSWRGEHAGKWLYAAAMAYQRTGDEQLRNSLTDVADFILEQQRSNGYTGTYVDTLRFYANPVQHRQVWDVWINGYILKGLIETAKVTGEEKYLDASRLLADLFIQTFLKDGKDICNSGCFSGAASAGVIVEFADLYEITGEKKYLDFAEFVIDELNRRPGTEMMHRLLAGYDMALIGEGKMYENIRCINGIVKVYLHTRKPEYLDAAMHAWEDIVANHLNPAGAPSGGVGIHHECFNVNYMFSPYQYSETCALMEWIVLNALLHRATRDGKFAEQLEKSAYNAMAGARFAEGMSWQYHSVMNGTRQKTGEWACCSSSGSVLLEDLARNIYTGNENNIWVNVYASSRVNTSIEEQPITIIQETGYPFIGETRLRIESNNPVHMSLHLRIPQWAPEINVTFNRQQIEPASEKGYMVVTRQWKNGDELVVNIPMAPWMNTAVKEYNEKGWYLDGRWEYGCLNVGPLLYATNHTDKISGPNPLSLKNIDLSGFVRQETNGQTPYDTYAVYLPDGESIQFVPYYDINEREAHTDHAVWFLKD